MYKREWKEERNTQFIHTEKSLSSLQELIHQHHFHLMLHQSSSPITGKNSLSLYSFIRNFHNRYFRRKTTIQIQLFTEKSHGTHQKIFKLRTSAPYILFIFSSSSLIHHRDNNNNFTLQFFIVSSLNLIILFVYPK